MPVKQLKILFNQLSPTLLGCVFLILNIELTGKSKKLNISFGEKINNFAFDEVRST